MSTRTRPAKRRSVFLLCALAGIVLALPGPVSAQPEPPVPAKKPADTAAADKNQEKTAPAEPGKKDILNMDIEQLAKTEVVVHKTDVLAMNMEVTSVAKEKSTVGQSPAAVFVITQDMIRRSGVTTIPEALRMAPGVEVARINASTWAITIRGFNSQYADKLLVMIDGRTVYTPVFAGVHWDVQDVLLEDIERIEVIRGPGGTLWGANAVNGVINILTKRAKDTQGAYVTAGGGTSEKMDDGVRYGGRIGEDLRYRVYGKHFDRGPGYAPEGAHDDWRQGRGGFRADWDPDKSDSLTVQGDYYGGESGIQSRFINTTPPFVQPVVGDDYLAGENVLTRWKHTYDEDSDWTLQMYYDHYRRNGPVQVEMVRTLDVDFQYRFPLTERQKIIWGADYRLSHDDLPSKNYFSLHFDPQGRNDIMASAFVQDEITLVEDLLAFTVGSKFEDNNFTGFEYQPSGRLLWTPDKKQSAWAAVSRAVRTPSRVDDAIQATAAPAFGVFPRLYGNPRFKSEDLMAYELGYRVQATERFAWDLAMFYNVYEDLKAVNPGAPFLEFTPPPPHVVFPLILGNNARGQTYGTELAANWTVAKWWRIYGQYTFLRLHTDQAFLTEGTSPHNQVYLRSSWDLTPDWELDIMTRYVDNLPGLNVGSYISMDVRLGWRPKEHLEIAVVGQNLLESHHREFAETIERQFFQTTEVDRGVYGTITWRY
ncbi:MAG: TonB-dependent receptor plug domain-containing protein [Pirellulales bacterium]